MVAVAALLVAALNGHQGTLMAPTEILAEQHFMTISRLLSRADLDPDGEPVVELRAAGMSSPLVLGLLLGSQTKRVKDGVRAMLAQGAIDIVIGTHRLLQTGVTWKDLGLIVVDEEQRFGVEHKEHIKSMRTHVDVLTMSATPIPRTLEMSLAGIREMSTILPPPEADVCGATRRQAGGRRAAPRDAA